MTIAIAPGGPGSRPTWTSSAKDIVTTGLGYQPGVGHAGLWHSQRGLLASNRATADSGSGVHRGGTIRLVRGETRQPLPDLHARRLDAVTAGHAPRRLLSVGDRSGS